MSSGFETTVQVAGLAAAVVGTYFAYRQYRQTHDHGTSGEPRAATSSGTAAEDAAQALERRIFKSKSRPSAGGGIASVLFFLGGAILLAYAVEDGITGGGLTVAAAVSGAIGLGMLAGAFRLFDEGYPFKIELDEMCCSVIRVRRRPLRIPWTGVDHIAVKYTKGSEYLVAVLPRGGGLIAGVPEDIFSRPDNGYIICRMIEVEPSREALLDALAHYSGSEVASIR